MRSQRRWSGPWAASSAPSPTAAQAERYLLNGANMSVRSFVQRVGVAGEAAPTLKVPREPQATMEATVRDLEARGLFRRGR